MIEFLNEVFGMPEVNFLILSYYFYSMESLCDVSG